MTNDILLLDGVKYIRYTPKNEDEFERMVVENAREIFGEEAIYLDIKKLIKNALGEGTIPDGFLFYPEQRRFVLVEVELSNHPVYEHISKQVNKFISAFSNYRARQKLATVLKEYIEEEPNLVKRMKPLLGSKGLYEFLEFEVFELLADNRNFEVIVIIEEETPTVCEALSWLKPTPQIIEVAIYARENAENVKAMRFVPTYIIEKIPTPQKELVSKKQGKILVEKSSNIVKELYDELKDWYLKEFESATFNLTGDYLGLAYQPSGLKRSYNICTVHSKCNWLRLHLRLEFDSIENPPAFAEKVDWFKWWKDGDTMARIRTESELTEAKRLIKLAYKQVEQWANPVSRTEHEPTVTTKVTGNPLPTSAYKLPILAVLIKNDGYLHRNDFLSTIEINMLDSMTDADYGKTKNGRREIWKDHAASMAHRMKKKGLIVCKGGKNWEITAKGRKYYEKYKDTGISGDNLNLKNNLIRKRKTPSQTNDPIDTIIVPAREDGFQETFLGKNCWYQIRLSKSKIPVLKYIAVYRKAPISAITHIAEIDRIEEYQNSGKYIVYFKGKAREIEHINRQEGGFAPQCPVFTSRERLRKAKSVSDVI